MSRKDALVFPFVMQCPVDATDDLGCANCAGEGGMIAQVAHQLLPYLWPSLPGERVGAGMNDSHNAISNQGHGGEVFPAFLRQEHGHHLSI